MQLLTTENFSGISEITTFKLQITCVSSISPSSQLGDVTYYVSDPQ